MWKNSARVAQQTEQIAANGLDVGANPAPCAHLTYHIHQSFICIFGILWEYHKL